MSNNISLQKNKTGKRKLQSTSSKKRSERKKTPRKIKKKRRCRRMRAPWQLLGCAPPSPPPSGKKQSVMREWEKETGWGGGDGMTAGWMVGDGWNNGILARVPVCVSVCDILWLCVCVWVGGRSDATQLDFAGSESSAASDLWPACCAWFNSFTMTTWDKKYKYLDANQRVCVCLTYMTWKDMSEWNESPKKKEKEKKDSI